MNSTDPIIWHLHTDSYGDGLYTFDTWWLTQNGRSMSPRCPADHFDPREIEHYTNGQRFARILRTRTEHDGEYRLIGRAYCGHAHHFLAIECSCSLHLVIANEVAA